VVLIGCASSGTAIAETNSNAGGTGTEDGGAVQLATDLGKAVNGGTVTLSGWAGLKTALTVPEGVTLDLTADGAVLELQDGAVLTVNGTVNATGRVLHVGDGAVVIAGTGTINLKSKGRLLNIGSDKSNRKLTLDGVTLVGLPDNDQSLVGINENGEFILKSGAITGNTRINDDWASGGGVEVGNGGTFTMEGGEVSGNTVKNRGAGGVAGGGVKVADGGTFTMSGGEISGNKVISVSGNAAGGGVELSPLVVFTVSGGTISSNTADSGDRIAVGGLCFGFGPTYKQAATIIMKGGTIAGNTATTKSETFSSHGAVFLNSGAFIMEGGTIYGKADSLPAGTDISLANSGQGVSMWIQQNMKVKWGTGGTYTQGGVPKTGGSDIEVRYNRGAYGRGTDDTLIAIPAK
jgi:hypothetical protein